MEVKSFIIPADKIKYLRGRTDIMYALMDIVYRTNSLEVDIKFDDLAKICKYKNRSGAWKGVNYLIKHGLVEKVNGKLLIKLEVISNG